MPGPRRAAPLLIALLAAVVIGPPATAAGATRPPAAGTVTVRIDPSYRQPAFEGWGTSLVWFANITGGYPEEIRNRQDSIPQQAGGGNRVDGRSRPRSTAPVP
jgi:hypothetical protein